MRPTLILLVGIPGSGKTTYAKSYIKQFGGVHLSSDAIRKELYGAEEIQGSPAEIFSLMQKRAVEALNNGNNVLYDATNMTRKDRAGIISTCPKFVQIECHVIWAPIETCIERDAVRDRTVGEGVIKKMLSRFQFPFYTEGIDKVVIVKDCDFDGNAYIDKCFNANHISHDNPHHSYNIDDHCLAAQKYAAENDFDKDVQMAALWHDIGKFYVKAFTDAKGNPSEKAHYYGHQSVSAWIVCGSPMVTPEIAFLVSEHMSPFVNEKYYNSLPPCYKEKLAKLHEADLAGH